MYVSVYRFCHTGSSGALRRGATRHGMVRRRTSPLSRRMRSHTHCIALRRRARRRDALWPTATHLIRCERTLYLDCGNVMLFSTRMLCSQREYGDTRVPDRPDRFYVLLDMIYISFHSSHTSDHHYFLSLSSFLHSGLKLYHKSFPPYAISFSLSYFISR